MNMKAKDIPVNKQDMTALIDVTNEKVIYIVENGKVQAIPLPSHGILELPCQNYKVGNLAYRITLKR